jgi:hypothetical protein
VRGLVTRLYVASASRQPPGAVAAAAVPWTDMVRECWPGESAGITASNATQQHTTRRRDASTISDHIGSPDQVSRAGRRPSTGPERVPARGKARRARLVVLRSGRRRSEPTPQPAGAMATAEVLPDPRPDATNPRPPAARPPAWVEELAPELVETPALHRTSVGHPPDAVTDNFISGAVAQPEAEHPASSGGPDGLVPDREREDSQRPDPSSEPPLANGGGGTENRAADIQDEKPDLSSAAQPPAWALKARAPSRADQGPSPTSEHPRRRSGAVNGSRHRSDTSGGPADSVYQIGWRAEQERGVFELQPVTSSEINESSWAEQSSPVPWGWRMAPAPIPEARRAHAALVDTLLAAGWRRAGSGNAWFDHRFRPPELPDADAAAASP